MRELIIIAGRRSGKDSTASAIATVAAIGDYSAQLRPGERASVLCLAVDRDQARIVQRYIAGYFRQEPLLAPLVVRETEEGLELTNNCEIVVATNSYRAVRGRTVACAIFDEAAFWRAEDSANPDVETYAAVMPAMVTLHGAILVVISTAYRRSGLVFEKWSRYFGRDGDDVLVVYGPSTAFNPTLPEAVIAAALESDPEAAAAEWLSEWRSDLADFLDRELVDAAVDVGVVARQPAPGVPYVAFADPSGGRGDAFTAAIAHAEGTMAVLDALYERRAPFDPGAVVAEIAALLREYGLATITGDRYGAGWTTEGFAKEGIGYQASERDRSALYLDALPLFTSGRARLLDSPRLIHQLVSLERRTGRLGRDRVDHRPGGSDDLANAAAGALVLASASAAPVLWRGDDLLSTDGPIRWPVRVVAIYATAAIDDRALAVCFWASGGDRYGCPGRLLLIDFFTGPLRPDVFTIVASQLAALAREPELPQHRPAVLGICCPSILAPHAERGGLAVFADGDAPLANRELLLLAAGAQLGCGAVKICDRADETSRSIPLPLTAVRGDLPPSAPQIAALLGIATILSHHELPVRWVSCSR